MSRPICVLMLSTSVCVPYAAAQTVEPYELDAISVDAASDDGNSIAVDAEDLALQNPTDLQDLFSGEPTVAVGSSIPTSQKLYVNGVEETNLAVTIDGARQNNRIFHHNATTLIDPALLKAARIDSGVAPADGGPGALAGSVAYETKDVGDLLAEGDNFGGSFATEIESNGEILTNSATLFGRSGGFEALGFLKYAEGDVREDGDGETITGSGTNLTSGLLKFAYEAQSGDRLEFSFEQVKDDEERPYRANIGEITAGRPVPLTRNYDLQRQNYVLTYTDETPQGFWDPKVLLSYSVTDLELDEDEQYTAGSTESLSGVAQNTFALGLGEVVAGIDFFSDSADVAYRYYADTSENYTAEEKAANVGVFTQARLDLSDSAHLSFGVRADFSEFEGTDGSSFDDNGVSGNISGQYDITDTVTVSAGYSRVWGGVALAENFIMNPAWVYPDDGIDPVTADNIFVASTAHFGSWNLNAKLFKTEIEDARTASYGGGPDVKSDLDAEGFEVGVGYAWADGMVRVAYANIETEVNGNTADSYSGTYLTTPIGEMITLQVQHSFVDRGLTVGANAEIALEEEDTYDVDTGAAASPLPAYEVVNAFAEYVPSFAPTWTLRGEISNLFDETYASRATYGQEYTGSVVPLNEPGRSIAISASKSF